MKASFLSPTFSLRTWAAVVLAGALTLSSAAVDAGLSDLSSAITPVNPPPSSVEVGQLESDSDIFVFEEVRNQALSADLEVDITTAGSYGLPLSPGVIPKGTVVSSYFVHVDPTLPTQTYRGRLSADEEILGIIASSERLDASDSIVGSPTTAYPAGLATRGYELSTNDSVQLDGHRVTIDVSATNWVDQLRIVTVATTSRFSVSLDIGSDSEFSDPNADGDEVIDPGDVFQASTGTTVDVVFDDVSIFAGGDPAPSAPAPMPLGGACPPPGAPVCYDTHFDLDGFDTLSVNLAPYLADFGDGDNPLLASQITENPEAGCISRARNLAISFDDDSGAGWGMPNPPRVPVEGPSPAGVTYGTTVERDEIVGLTMAGGAFPMPVANAFRVADETSVHPALSPNPDVDEADDDDIDALDERSEGDCEFVLFSADHEARNGLMPGAIYMTLNGGAAPVMPLIRPGQHLGLPAETDIDAFEIVWLPVNPEDPMSPIALGLLFSVDDDDPRTPAVDESGGANPRVIYGSFLNGTSFAYSNPLRDDVDAITVLTNRPDGGVVVEPTFKRGDSNGDGSYDISDAFVALNWLFLGGPAPECMDAADADDTGVIELTDPVYFLSWRFLGGPRPPAPSLATCGPDPSEDPLGCESYPICE